MRRKNSGFVFFLIVLLMCGGGAFYYYSPLVKEREKKEENLMVCLDNLREIAKAAAESNKIRAKTNQRLISHPSTLDLKTLVAEKFLKVLPVCPDAGTYQIQGFFGQSDGRIACSFHGTTYDPMKIKWF